MVSRAGATGGAELDLAPGRTPPALQQAVRAETEPGDGAQVRDRAGDLKLAGGRYGIERGEVRCGEVSWQRNRLERRVDLVRERLDSRVLLAHGRDTMGRLAHQDLRVCVRSETGGTEVLRRVVEPPGRGCVLVLFGRHLVLQPIVRIGLQVSRSMISPGYAICGQKPISRSKPSLPTPALSETREGLLPGPGQAPFSPHRGDTGWGRGVVASQVGRAISGTPRR